MKIILNFISGLHINSWTKQPKYSIMNIDS